MKEKILSVITNEKIKTWQIFLVMLLLNIIQVMIKDSFFWTKETYHALLSSKLESYQIDNYYMMSKHYSIYHYLSIPLMLFVRTITVTMLLQVLFLFSRLNLSFNKLFRISLFGLGFLLFGRLAQTIKILFIPYDQLTEKLLNVMPLSVSNTLNVAAQDTLTIGVLNTLNIFELAWLVVIGYLIANTFQINYKKSVFYTLCVWIMVFVFQFGIFLYLTRVYNA